MGKFSSCVMKSTRNGTFLLLSVLLGLVSSEITLTHQSLAKRESDSFIVSCKDNTGEGLSWKGPKSRPLGEKTNPQAKATMYGIHLVFKKIKKEDAGIYTCRTNTQSAEFELIVTSPIEFVDTPSIVFGQEGKNVLLKCEATEAKTTWRINGEEPNNDIKYNILADALQVKDASVEDSRNNYTCMAFNTAAGEVASKRITLIVTHPPRPRFMKVNIVHGYLGGVVNLTCEVHAEPSPSFSWSKKGSNKKIIGQELQGSTNKSSILRIVLQKSQDLGDYKCEAKNDEGRVEIIFTVLNSTQPDPPELLEIKNSNSSTLFLKIEEPYIDENTTDELPPTGFLVEYRSVDEPQWNRQSFVIAEDKMYPLINLTKNTTYQVRAATVNVAGYSEFTNITEYTTSSAYIFSNLRLMYIVFSVVLIFTNDLAHHCT